MELYQLRSFITVAETGNLTQASERLFTSQPAVSAHIKALEEEFNLKLFKRSAKGMRLTAEGEALMIKARQILDLSSDLKTRAKAMQSSIKEMVHIGLNSDADYLRLGRWHNILSRQYPSLKIQLSQDTSVKLLGDVKSGVLDVTFFSGDPLHSELEYVELFQSNAVVAATAQWAEKMLSASLEQLAVLPWIQPEDECIFNKLMQQMFSQSKVKPDHIIRCATDESTMKLLLAGIGLALVCDEEIETQRQKGEIVVWPEVAYPLPLRLAYHRERKDDATIQALLEIIPRQFDDHAIRQPVLRSV